MILTIYYDGHCPLCMKEMQLLKRHDIKKYIKFVDLHNENFSNEYPHIKASDAIKILHGQLNTGELLLGLDVTCRAWNLVGKHKWLAILRWPLIRTIADIIYRLFARYRNRISHLLTGQKNCNSCNINK
ncbi:MAG: DUF393 domain-containing protein [Gammaproteobacteria bacterium]|nr:DUF393 domain-containing protein [Gammaproteobacteria bacterium]